MEGHAKCAECTRRGHPCVPVSLESLNRVHISLSAELEAAEAEHDRILARIQRLRKMIIHNKTWSIAKAQCIAAELGDDNNGVSGDEDDPGPSDLFASLSPSFWDGLNPASPSNRCSVLA